MKTNSIAGEILSTVDNPERFKLILRGCHVVDDNSFDIFNHKNNRRVDPQQPTLLEVKRGLFKDPDVIMILDKVQVIYIVGDKINRSTRACIKIQGSNAEVHHISKTTLKKSLSSFKENDVFLNGDGWKILYFPRGKEDILFFCESDNLFVVDDVGHSYTNDTKLIKSTKGQIINSIVENIYNIEI